MPLSAQKYFQLVFSPQFVIIFTMNCACLVFKTSGSWSKIGTRKDTCLHHSMLSLFLVSLCTAPTPFIIFGVFAAT